MMPIAMIALVCSIFGWLPVGWGGMTFVVSSLILFVWVGVNGLYIVDPGKVGLPRVFGHVVKRTLEPGLNFIYPFITDVHEIPANKVIGVCKVAAIETTKVYSFAVEIQYEYQINWKNAWMLMDNILDSKSGYDVGAISNFINMYMSEIVKDHYRGIDLDTFYANKSLQRDLEDDVKDKFVAAANQKFKETCGASMFQILNVGYISYVPDPDYEKAKKDANIALQKKQEAITNADAEKEVRQRIADALRYAKEQEGKGEASKILEMGLKNAEVQKALGKVLRDHPGLTLFEAVKHLPHYLSLVLGGNTNTNLDIAQFMAVIEERFGSKKTESETTDSASTTESTPSAPVEDAEAEEIVEPTEPEPKP